MNLNNEQRRELHRALIEAYPNIDDLELFVFLNLGHSLDRIAGRANLDVMVMKVIQWAEAEGEVEKLIIAAAFGNRGNHTLAALARGPGITQDADQPGVTTAPKETSQARRPTSWAAGAVRQLYVADVKERLRSAVETAPLQGSEDFAYLHVGAWPVSSTEALLDQARGTENQQTMLNALVVQADYCSAWPRWDASPGWGPPTSWYRCINGWQTYLHADPERQPQREPDDVLDLRVNDDGSALLFCGRAAERRDGQLWVLEPIVAGAAARFYWLLGQLYQRANYDGVVDLGVALTGLRGALPLSLRWPVAGFPVFKENEYQRTARVVARGLMDAPRSMAGELLGPFFRALTQDRYDPLAEQPK